MPPFVVVLLLVQAVVTGLEIVAQTRRQEVVTWNKILVHCESAYVKKVVSIWLQQVQSTEGGSDPHTFPFIGIVLFAIPLLLRICPIALPASFFLTRCQRVMLRIGRIGASRRREAGTWWT